MIYAKVVLTIKYSTHVCCWPIQFLLVLDQGGKQTREVIKLARVLAFDCALGTPILAVKLSGGISNDCFPRGAQLLGPWGVNAVWGWAAQSWQLLHLQAL